MTRRFNLSWPRAVDGALAAPERMIAGRRREAKSTDWPRNGFPGARAGFTACGIGVATAPAEPRRLTPSDVECTTNCSESIVRAAPQFFLALFVGAATLPAAAADQTPPKSMYPNLAKPSGCDPKTMTAEYVSYEELNSYKWKVWTITGCGEPFIASYTTWAGGWKAVDDRALRKKAPFDLSCEAGQLAWTFIDTYNRGVSGCGQKVTYVYVPQTQMWVANLASSAPSVPAAAPAAPPIQ